MSKNDCSNRDNQLIKELNDYLEDLETKCNEEYNLIKARAYGAKIEEIYTIRLRDDFNENKRKYEMLDLIKMKLFEITNKKE